MVKGRIGEFIHKPKPQKKNWGEGHERLSERWAPKPSVFIECFTYKSAALHDRAN